MSKSVKEVITKAPSGSKRHSNTRLSTEPAAHPAESGLARSVVRNIRQALATGDHLEARRLSEQGAMNHPESIELQKWAAILAPSTVRESELPANPSLGKNFKWLKESSGPYKGLWVALLNGEFLGAAPRLNELKKTVKPPPGTLLTRIV